MILLECGGGLQQETKTLIILRRLKKNKTQQETCTTKHTSTEKEHTLGNKSRLFRNIR